MRFRHHPGYPPPSPDVVESVKALLAERGVTDAWQGWHDTTLCFGDLELSIEGPWRLHAPAGDLIEVGDEGGQSLDWDEQEPVTAALAVHLHRSSVAEVKISGDGDLLIDFDSGCRLECRTRPSGLQAWVLSAGRLNYVAAWGGLLEREEKDALDAEGIWRVLRGA